MDDKQAVNKNSDNKNCNKSKDSTDACKKSCNCGISDFFTCPNSCYPASVTAIAYSLAKCYSLEELELLAVLFTQLGDTIASILVIQNLNAQCAEENEDSINPLTEFPSN